MSSQTPAPAAQFRSDVVRRAPIDSGLIRRAPRDASSDLNSEQYLAQVTEDWHKRVDTHVKSLASGMGALVQSALLKMPDPARKEENRLKNTSEEEKIKIPKDKYHARHDAFQAQMIAENMVVAVDSLLTITHSLKLMYLLSDEEEISTRKARDLREMREETRTAKEAVAKQWGALFDEDGEDGAVGEGEEK